MADEADALDEASDTEVFQRAIEAQEYLLAQFESEWAAAVQGGDATAAEEAEYRLFQARRYLDELTADRNEVARTPPEVLESLARTRRVRRGPSTRKGLAVVIGHSPTGDMGAVGLAPPLPHTPREARCEYYWNREVAEQIKANLTARGIRCEVFHRLRNAGPGILEAYRQVIDWGAEAAVELHFNCSNGTARGTETLYELPPSRRWADVLQAALVKLYGHEGRTSERGAKLDRGVKLASRNGRGTLSLTQMSPSALIEPFFGDNRVDAELAMNMKPELAATLADAFVSFIGASVQPETGTSPTVPAPTQPSTTPPLAALWDRLREAYSAASIEFPKLKGISYAQWGLESGYGTSYLAREHLNFGGMKYRDFLADIAIPIEYTDGGGRRDKYCKFSTFENFFKGYWRRFDKIESYQGWRNHVDTPEGYFNFIADIYAPPSENPSYKSKVIGIYERLRREGKLPMEAAAPAPQPGGVDTTQPSGGTTTPPQLPPSSGDQPTAALELVAAVRRAAPADGAHFLALAEKYAFADIPYPGLKLITLAQWALESNWGRSPLAQIHYNFAGMEWSDSMSSHGAPVDYRRQEGSSELYCRFLRLQDFIAGYWTRLNREAIFAGWEQHVGSASAFMSFLAPRWRPTDQNYVRGVTNIFERFAVPGRPPVGHPSVPTKPPGTAQPPAPTPSTPATPPAPTEVSLDGFIIRVNRVRTELRDGWGHARTVGLYQAYFDHQPIAELQGVCFERQGPGDNSPTGRKYKRRVAAGTYPLHTQDGDHYVTHGYTGGTSYPKPGILLGNTGARIGILFHPGSGYLSSTGCINFSRPLSGATADIDFSESRSRVIAMIEGMKLKLGERFPNRNGKQIPDTWIIIEGEPETTTVASERTRVSIEESDPAVRAPAAAMRLTPGEAYDLLAATMNGEVLPERISLSKFLSLADRRSDLETLRNDDGQNLWFEWASGWQALTAVHDPELRARMQSELAEIARRLMAAGVDVNDIEGQRTPLTAAAVGNQWEAIAYLHDLGADLNLRDRLGDTPLTAAAFQGSLETCEFLIGAGADRTLKTAEPRAAASTRSAIGVTEDGETCAVGSTPIECARAGTLLRVEGDPRRVHHRRIELLLGS